MDTSKSIWVSPARAGINWASRKFSGPDCRDFLHRITTLDTRRLSSGAPSSWGFILTASGKIRSAFHLACTGPEEFWFEYDLGPDSQWDQALVEAIDQFTFSERQSLGALQCAQAAQGSLASVWCFGVLPEKGLLESSALRVIEHGSLDFRRPWWTLWGESEAIEALVARSGGAHANAADLAEWRLESLRPWYSREVTPDAIPLELGLADGIAQAKGCYPGQEVIERLFTQGAPPRRLARLKGAHGRRVLALVRKNEITPGTLVRLSDGFEGQVEKCVD